MKVICPNCKNETQWENNEFKPFCSQACKDRDLGNWAAQRYRIPEHEVDDGSPTRKEEE